MPWGQGAPLVATPNDPAPPDSGWTASSLEWARQLLAPVSSTPWVQALVALAAAMVLAKLVDLLLRLALKVVAKRTTTLFDDRLFELVHKPVVQSVLLFGVLLATAFLAPVPATALLVRRLVMSLFVLAWCVFFLRAAASFLRAASNVEARFRIIEPRTFPLFSNLATLVILAIAAWCLIGLWGANMTGWLASAGVAGLAIGFAAQDTLANLFAGVFVIADAPFRVGDFIVLDTGDRGRVVHIGLRSTRLLTRDDVEITIPNSVIGGGRITNQSSGPSQSMRVKLPVQVAYGSDVDQVEALLMELAAAESLALEDPAPRVRFRQMADSGLNFELLVWVADPSLRGRAVHALNRAIYKRLMLEGIEIPYPKRDVYLHQA